MGSSSRQYASPAVVVSARPGGCILLPPPPSGKGIEEQEQAPRHGADIVMHDDRTSLHAAQHAS